MTTKHPSIKELNSELDKTLENFKTERSSQLKEIEELKNQIEEMRTKNKTVTKNDVAARNYHSSQIVKSTANIQYEFYKKIVDLH